MRCWFPISIACVLVVSFLAASASPAPAQSSDAAPLVTRGGIDLNLRGAQTILEGAQKKAQEIGVPVNLAIVDDGGHSIAFVRMDGARPASGYTAQTKAQAAATF